MNVNNVRSFTPTGIDTTGNNKDNSNSALSNDSIVNSVDSVGKSFFEIPSDDEDFVEISDDEDFVEISDDENEPFFDAIDHDAKVVEVKEQPQGTLDRLTNNIARYTFFAGCNPDKVIESKIKELNELGAHEIVDTIHNTITPQLMDAIITKVPDLAYSKWVPGSHAGITFLLKKHQGEISKWVEANLLTIFANLAQAAKASKEEAFRNGEGSSRGVGSSSPNILADVVNYVASLTNSNIDVITVNLNSIDAEIAKDEAIMKQWEGSRGVSTDAVKQDIALLNQEKQKILNEIIEAILAKALPNGDEDLTLPNPIPGFNLPGFALSQIKKNLAPFLLDLVTKMRKSSATREENLKQIQNLPGANDLVGLIAVLTKQFKEVVLNELKSQKSQDARGLKKIITELAQTLGIKRGVQLEKVLDTLGGYCEPILLHVFANLAQGRTEGDQRHILTGILENLLKDLIQSFNDLDKAYKEYQGKVDAINNKYGVEGNEADKQKELDQAFEPLKKIFANFADPFVKKAGIDTEGLEKIIPIGAAELAEYIKKSLNELFIQYYKDIYEPRTHECKLKDQIADFNESAVMIDKILMEQCPFVKKKIKELKNDIGQSAIEKLQKILLLQEAPAGQNLIEQPIQELCDSPVFDELLEKQVLPLIQYNILHLLANLAVNKPGRPAGQKAKLLEDGIQHLLQIVGANVTEPRLLEQIAEWKAMAETTEEEKRAKEVKKVELLKIFEPTMRALLAQVDFDQITLPENLKASLKDDLQSSILPNVIFNVVCDYVMPLVPLKFTSEENRVIAKLSDKDISRIVDQAIEMGLPKGLEAVQGKAPVLAMLINQKAVGGTLTGLEEAFLADNLNQLFEALKAGNCDQFLGGAKGLISIIIKNGLLHLAAAGPEKGDALANALLQIRKIISEQTIDNKNKAMLNKITKYLDNNGKYIKQLNDKKAEINRNRKEMLNLYKTKESLSEGEQKVRVENQLKVKATEDEKLIEEMKVIESKISLQRYIDKLNENDAFSQANSAHISKLTQDLGRLTQELERLPEGDEKLTKENEKKQVEETIKELTQDQIQLSEKRKKIEGKKVIIEEYQQLKGQFKPLVTAVLKGMGYDPEAFPAPLKALLDDEVTGLILESYIETSKAYRSRIKHKGSLNLRFPNLDPQKPDKTLSKAVKDLAAFAVKKLDNFLVVNSVEIADLIEQGLDFQGHHLERIPGNNHMGEIGKVVPKSGEFLFPILQKEIYGQLLEILDNLTGNLKTMEEQNPEKMFDLTLELVELLARHLEKVRDLNPPHQLMNQVEAGIMKNGFRDAAALHFAMYNEEAKKAFYKDLGMWLLKVAGKNGPQDLKVPYELEKEVWKLITETAIPDALSSVLGMLGTPEMIDKILVAGILENINTSLSAAANNPTVPPAGPAQPLTDAALQKQLQNQQRLTRLINVLCGVLPPTMATNLLPKLTHLPKVGSLPAKNLEPVIKDALKDWPLSKIVAFGIFKGAAALEPDLDKKAPVTQAEILDDKNNTATNDQVNNAKVTTEAKEIPVKAKTKVLAWLEHSIIGTLFGWLLRPLIGWIFGKVESSVGQNAQRVRDEINTPINANFVYNGLDALVRHYPAPEARSSASAVETA